MNECFNIYLTKKTLQNKSIAPWILTYLMWMWGNYTTRIYKIIRLSLPL